MSVLISLPLTLTSCAFFSDATSTPRAVEIPQSARGGSAFALSGTEPVYQLEHSEGFFTALKECRDRTPTNARARARQLFVGFDEVQVGEAEHPVESPEVTAVAVKATLDGAPLDAVAYSTLRSGCQIDVLLWSSRSPDGEKIRIARAELERRLPPLLDEMVK